MQFETIANIEFIGCMHLGERTKNRHKKLVSHPNVDDPVKSYSLEFEKNGGKQCSAGAPTVVSNSS